MLGEASTVEPDITSSKKKEKELVVVQDTGFFTHDTGDTYEGSFEAKKKDKSVKMNGLGVYRTHNGDSYAGFWEADKLGGGDAVVITYSSGAKYEGYFKDWAYNGKGRYTYPDGSVLSGEFQDNCPVGNLKLIDPNGHQWLGKADGGIAWFRPFNHYYDVLDTVLDKAELKKRRAEHRSLKDAVVKPEETEVPEATPVKKKVQIAPTVSASKPSTKK